MIDWAFIDFLGYLAFLPIAYLTWASGYLRLLTKAARRNRWGLDLLRKRGLSESDDSWDMGL